MAGKSLEDQLVRKNLGIFFLSIHPKANNQRNLASKTQTNQLKKRSLDQKQEEIIPARFWTRTSKLHKDSYPRGSKRSE